MMKADVLSGFEQIPVCHTYEHDGATKANLPFGIEPDEVTPAYTDRMGWQEDLTGVTTVEGLPSSLHDYIAMVEDKMKIPVKVVSVGPDRAQTIHR